MTSLCPKINGERQVDETLLRVAWDEIVRRSVLTKTKFAIISYQAVHDYIQSGAIPPGSKSLKDSPYFCGNGYFGNIRGQDVFNKKKVRHLYVIGRQNVGDGAVKDRARAIFARDPEPLNFEQHTVSKLTPVGNLRDKQYKDERVQAVNRMMNSAETAQAAHRLRLIHGNVPKKLFLLTNEILPLRVNHYLCLEKNISKGDHLLVELKKALEDDGVAIKIGTRWKYWPDCLKEVEDRTRRKLLDRAVEDAALCTYHLYEFQSVTKQRKKRTGVVLGMNEERCREGFLKAYPGDKSLELKSYNDDSAP